jgi:hypothetical protein
MAVDVLFVASSFVATTLLSQNTTPFVLRDVVEVIAFAKDRASSLQPLEVRYREESATLPDIPFLVESVLGIGISAKPPLFTIAFSNVGNLACYGVKSAPPVKRSSRGFPAVWVGLPVTISGEYTFVSTAKLSQTGQWGAIQCFSSIRLSERDSFDHRSVRFLNPLLSSYGAKQVGIQYRFRIRRLMLEFHDLSDDSADTIIEGGIEPSVQGLPAEATREVPVGGSLTTRWRVPSLTSQRDLLLLIEGSLFALIAGLLVEIWKLWMEEWPESGSR